MDYLNASRSKQNLYSKFYGDFRRKYIDNAARGMYNQAYKGDVSGRRLARNALFVLTINFEWVISLEG